jgi:hypothetical protein
MTTVTRYPLLVFVLSVLTQWLAARFGPSVLWRRRGLDQAIREDFSVIVAATLTLLALIIGFSFSMAITRYDQRKTYEEDEANAIGTEYLRADLLPAADGANVRALLKRYVDQRILFYTTRDSERLNEISARTVRLQTELWSAVKAPAIVQPTPLMALAVGGMNDVLNSEGYTQAAWWNRIPVAAWALMLAIAIASNVLIGYGVRDIKSEASLLLVLPLIVSIAFFLIADIDSPRTGIIRVIPQNLSSLAESLRAP